MHVSQKSCMKHCNEKKDFLIESLIECNKISDPNANRIPSETLYKILNEFQLYFNIEFYKIPFWLQGFLVKFHVECGKNSHWDAK